MISSFLGILPTIFTSPSTTTAGVSMTPYLAMAFHIGDLFHLSVNTRFLDGLPDQFFRLLTPLAQPVPKILMSISSPSFL